MLAQRLLIYGSGPLQYRCLSGDCTYDLADKPNNDIFDSSNFRISQKLFESVSQRNISIDDKQGLISDWSHLLENFQRRRLTKEMDIFLNCQYVAVLWSDSLPHSLLWLHDNNLKLRYVISTDFVAPSWSPTRARGAIIMCGPNISQYPQDRNNS